VRLGAKHTIGYYKSLELELPTINNKKVHVHFEDHMTYTSSIVVNVLGLFLFTEDLGGNILSKVEIGLNFIICLYY
jgi:hypothetical protein